MGATQSKSTARTDIVNQAVTDVIISSASNCSSNNAASQSLTFSDIRARGCKVNFSNINQEASISTNLSCAQDSNQNSNLASEFASKLDQSLEASLKGIPGAVLSNTETSTVTNMKNKIKNNINMSQIASCISSNMTNQKLNFGKIDVDCRGADPGDKELNFNNIGQRLIATHAASCIQGNKQVSEAATKIENILKQKQAATNSGIDPTASLASLGVWFLPSIISAIICCCVLVLGGIALFSMSDEFEGIEGMPNMRNVAAEYIRSRK